MLHHAQVQHHVLNHGMDVADSLASSVLRSWWMRQALESQSVGAAIEDGAEPPPTVTEPEPAAAAVTEESQDRKRPRSARQM